MSKLAIKHLNCEPETLMHYPMLIVMSMLGCAEKPIEHQTPNQETSNEPFDAPVPQRRASFIAIHCDPGASFPEELENLKSMLAMASDAEIPLTLMFTPQWVEPLIAAGGRELLLE